MREVLQSCRLYLLSGGELIVIQCLTVSTSPCTMYKEHGHQCIRTEKTHLKESHGMCELMCIVSCAMRI